MAATLTMNPQTNGQAVAPVHTTHYQALSDIHADLHELGRLNVDQTYFDKQLWKIPDAMQVERVTVCVEAARGKRVLHLGCGWPPGPLHQMLAGVAAHLIGVDLKAPAQAQQNVWQCDLDERPESLPLREYDVIIAGEVLEHLLNPGRLLKTIKRLFPTTMIVATVPNAYSTIGLSWIQKGYENVNGEHVAYYSWRTMSELLIRCGYAILNFGWYNGPPYVAEGLVFVVKPAEGV